ncbi:MAG TPA: hypothetical protein DEP84_07815 [Chloroflexi bacterium]|nr:hypothetical protein [Chloroflexota bacterium]
MLAEQAVDAIGEHWPTGCPHCQGELPPVPAEGIAPVRQQVWEVPPIKPTVVEHRDQAVCCPQGHRVVRACRPSEGPPGAFGPRLTSLVGLLNGRYRLSKREVAGLVQDACGVRSGSGEWCGP